MSTRRRQPGDEADQDARPDRPEQVADPAEDDDGKDEADPLECELRKDSLVDADQYPGHGGHCRRHAGSQHPDPARVHAERGGHLAVVGERPERLAEVRSTEYEERRNGKGERRSERHELRDGKGDVGDEQGARGVGVLGRLDLAKVGAPDVVDQPDRDDEEPEAEQERVELVHLEALDQPLHADTEDEHRGHENQRGEQRVGAGRGRQLIRDVRAEQDQREVREVDDLEQPPGQREAERHHRVEPADHHARDARLQVRVHVATLSLIPRRGDAADAAPPLWRKRSSPEGLAASQP